MRKKFRVLSLLSVGDIVFSWFEPCQNFFGFPYEVPAECYSFCFDCMGYAVFGCLEHV